MLEVQNPTIQLIEELDFSFLELLPTPAIIINKSGRVIELNDKSLTFFGFRNKDRVLLENDLDIIMVNHIQMLNLITEQCLKNEFNSQKLLLKKANKSIEGVETFSSFINNNEFIIIQFISISEKNRTIFSEFKRSLRTEVLKLKPYLNKPGKQIMEQIVSTKIFEGISEANTQNISHLDLIQRERIQQIVKLFPDLSENELTLCCFLSLNLTIDEISGLTDKTSNSLRVLFHRLLQKTNYSKGKNLIRKLKSLE